MSRKLIIEEPPLQVLPSLAKETGLNESIVLQQLHYWLKLSGKNKDGRVWVYNTYGDWQKQFPFWSIRTIRRIFNKLEEKGYILSANYNRAKMDQTKWYTINYDKIPAIDQVDHTNGSSCPQQEDSLTTPIPENTTETTKDINNIPPTETDNDDYPPEFEEFWEHYPRKIEKRAAFSKWKTRIKEGIEPDILTLASKNYADYCVGREPKFVKHGATFLGPNKHYEDFIKGLPEDRDSPDFDFLIPMGDGR